jgi:hypothetical protein
MYELTIFFKYPSLVTEMKIKCTTYFSKDELIERFNLNNDLVTDVIYHEKKEVKDETNSK